MKININEARIIDATDEAMIAGSQLITDEYSQKEQFEAVQIPSQQFASKIDLELLFKTVEGKLSEIENKIPEIPDEQDPSFSSWRAGERLVAGKSSISYPSTGSAYGANTVVSVEGAIALGANSAVRTSDTNGADYPGHGPLSVGDSSIGLCRRIIDVADGIMPTDAATVGQIMSGAGERGESAYEIAVRNGFKGTEQEWLESLKAPATTSSYRVIGDLSEEEKVFEFYLGRVRCKITRINATTFGVIMYADPNLEVLVQRIDNSDFSSNSEPAKKYTIVPHGTVLDDIPTTADRVSAIVTTENYSFRIDAIATSDFKECVVIVNQYANYEKGAEVEPKYKIRRWMSDLSVSGRAINVDVDGLRWTLKYKSGTELSWVVAPISEPVNVAFYRASIWTGGAENTPFAWKLLGAQTNVDETVHNNSQDWPAVRFITEKGSYKLEACAFDSGRYCEVLLHYISDIPNEE